MMIYSNKKYRYALAMFIAALAMAVTSSCSDDSPNSDITQLTAEMCVVSTKADKQIVSATTDSDRKLLFSSPFTTSWAQKGDSLYRALIYYNKVSSASLSDNVQPFRAEKVFVLQPASPEKAKKWTNDADPFDLTASWFAENGKYLNLILALKSGSVDNADQTQTIGLVCDTTIVSAYGQRRYCHLCHNQNGVPDYYTVDVYASVPTDDLVKGDTLTIKMPLTSGTIQKDYIK